MSEGKKTQATTEEPLLRNVINWGMSDDGIYQEFVEAVANMRNGFYTLVNYGGIFIGEKHKWWDAINLYSANADVIRSEWEKIDWDQFMDSMEVIATILAGAYLKYDKFAASLEPMKGLGLGCRGKDERRKK